VPSFAMVQQSKKSKGTTTAETVSNYSPNDMAPYHRQCQYSAPVLVFSDSDHLFYIPQFQFLTFQIHASLIYSQSTTNEVLRFSNLFISVRRSTRFRRFFRPSSGVQNCTYSDRHLSECYCYLLLEVTV